MSSLPIGDYALLSDRHSAALVSSGGSVDWLCMPRFDSPSIFAALLDDEAGHWSIHPDGEFRVERRYVDGSMVLLTTFDSLAGTLELRDSLVVGDTHDPHALGKHAPHLLARIVTCTRGRVGVSMSFRARPEYGLVTPMTTAVDGGLVATGGADQLTLSSTVPLDVEPDQTSARFELAAAIAPASPWSTRPSAQRDRRCARDLRSLPPPTTPWPAGGRGPGCIRPTKARGASSCATGDGCCRRSASSPPGRSSRRRPPPYPRWSAATATGTTGTAWVRDASLTMEALWVAACPDEADEFFEFMATAAAPVPADRRCRSCSGSAASTT